MESTGKKPIGRENAGDMYYRYWRQVLRTKVSQTTGKAFRMLFKQQRSEMGNIAAGGRQRQWGQDQHIKPPGGC
jgi:hypothetical protein